MVSTLEGAFSTGKSTTARELGLLGYNIVDEIAREIIASMGKLPQNMTEQEKIKFQMNIYAKQIAKEKVVPHNTIIDTGIHGNLAYTFLTNKDLYYSLRDHAKENHKGYRYVFVLPIEFSITNDGVRYIDKIFQQTVQNTLFGVLDHFGVEPRIITGSIKQRTSAIEDILENKNSWCDKCGSPASGCTCVPGDSSISLYL